MKPTCVLVHPVGTTCNIACCYCFHRQTDTQDFSRKMKVETFINFYRKWVNIIPAKTECEIIWHGGEPTLRGIDFYSQVLNESKLITPPAKIVKHCIQTNGTTMSKEWAFLFKKHEVLVGVSVDGPEELHDSFRVKRNGNGTFRQAIEAHNLLKEYGVPTGIVVVVNACNVSFPEKIFQFMKNHGILKIQLSPCMEFGDSKDTYSITTGQFEYFICRLYDLWVMENDPRISIGFISDIVDHLLGRGHSNCLLSDRCHDFVMLDWTGKIKTCDGMRIRQQAMGHVDLQNIDVSRFKDAWCEFHNQISLNRLETCKCCEWYDICHGGCPYHWPENGILKTSFCESNKRIFRHIATSLKSVYSGERPASVSTSCMK